METQKICWGLLYDTERELVAMPRPKIEKAAFLLADPELDAGNVNICHKFLEQYRGNQQYWSLVVPPLRTLTSATDALMKGGRQGGRTRPPGGDRHRQLIFEDFWRATETARILLADEEQWAASFVGAFSGVLSLNERLALPGRQCKLIWVTGDATPERVATVDWTHKRAATGDVQPFRAPLAAAIGEEDEDGDLIAIAEFLNLVTYAAYAGSSGQWRGSVAVYVWGQHECELLA